MNTPVVWLLPLRGQQRSLRFKLVVAAADAFALFFQRGCGPRQIKAALKVAGLDADNGQGHEREALLNIAAAFALNVTALHVIGTVKGRHAVVKGRDDGFAYATGRQGVCYSDKIIAADVPHKVILERAFLDDGRKALERPVAIFKAVFVVVSLEVVDIEVENNARQTKAHKAFQLNINKRVAGQF